MNTKSRILTTAMAALLATAPIIGATYARAADTTKAATEQTAAKETKAVDAQLNASEDKAIIKTMNEAYKALREIHAARLAIFNGTPEAATNFVNLAQADLQTASEKMKDYEVDKITPTLTDDAYIPFDTSMALSEGFMPTPEKQATLAKANEHLAKGDHKKAVDVLKLANIDVTISGAFIPVKASLSHVADASKLITEKKYYESNLALKAVEDSIVMQSFGIDEVPAQGVAG
ncbi:YfdX family protein [uncultured Hoeflea sp.]|uniref:YfdX family protein n=1 Tax=uncultured Hoeflea sp. TaxID=538666 RepID=UPI0030D82157|tara:strand:- start:1860 stop:2558 length:699 start_codon:yes stop_codon:yes gene_type:complete